MTVGEKIIVEKREEELIEEEGFEAEGSTLHSQTRMFDITLKGRYAGAAAWQGYATRDRPLYDTKLFYDLLAHLPRKVAESLLEYERTRPRRMAREDQVARGRTLYQLRRQEIEAQYLGKYVAIVDDEIHAAEELQDLEDRLLNRLIEEDKYAYVTKVGDAWRPADPGGFSFLTNRGSL
jgi:hypothetical protein